MKQKLLLIGNKPLKNDYSFFDDEFDYIFRVNRMCNFGNTGKRIDGLFLGAYPDFTTVFKGGEFKEYYKTAKDIYMTPLLKKYFWEYKLYISEEQYKNIKFFNFDKGIKTLGGPITSTVNILFNLVEDNEINNKYDIYLTGLDIENRNHLLSTGEPWKNTMHSIVGQIEEDFIKKIINDNKITFINCE